jgi:glycosyltransferase involved in cell wall biosynthesis
MRVTVGIPTKNRYDSLAATLLSLALQTHKEFDVIIVDDSDERKDLRELPAFQSILQLFNHFKIGWQVIWGRKLGQHYSHQLVQDIAKTEWIWRIDDDEVAEPNVLHDLVQYAVVAGHKIGAIGGLVLPPDPQPCPLNAANVISDLNLPSLQWFIPIRKGAESVQHLHSTFLYRKGIANYELGLSPAAHREETIFTHELYLRGHGLIVDFDIVTWHFRAAHGGIRSHQDVRFWEEDEKLFQDKLREWGIHSVPCKTIVIDGGRGDQVLLKSLLPALREKYGRLVIACCNNDIFEGEPDVELISIADAKVRLGNIDRFNVYRFMIDHNWKGQMRDAFAALYGVDGAA